MTDLPTDKQQIYDTTCRHIASLPARSMREVRGKCICAYRSENGLKCAIGALIPDEIYNTRMEAMSAMRLIEETPEFSMWEEIKHFLNDLQLAHDTFLNWERRGSMRSTLAYIAEINRLDASVLDGLHFITDLEPATI